MIRATLILLTAAALALIATGCGVRFSDGPHTVQTRSVSSFDRVQLRGSANVVVHRGSASTLTVEGSKTRVDRVVTRVQSGTLIVDERGSSNTLDLSGDDLTVTVATPRLNAVSIDGSGDVSLPELRGGPLQVHIDGSGDVNGHGRLDALDAAVDGSGDIDMGAVRVQAARVNLSGSGDADVHAVRTLHAEVSGSGDVGYAGNPALTRDVSGSGDVSHH
ncbi:MAG: GIN domain-containing protein [Solirubrobacteraceae bacterium]